MLLTWGASRGGAGTPSFALGFGDLGLGVVDTSTQGVSVAPTFTRATAASARLSAGLWKLDIASGQPRSHYSRAGVFLGFLAEGARTQILPGTDIRDMTTVNWVATNCTVTKNAVGIDGVASAACTLTATAANATVLLTVTAAATSRTYGAFIRRVTGTGNIDLTQDGASFTTVTVDGTYPETQQQLNATQLNAVIGIRIVTNGDSIVVDFNQFESGTFSSTPIPVATVTRNGDVLTFPFIAGLDTVGTAYAEAMSFQSGTFSASSNILAFANAQGWPLYGASGQALTTISMFDGTGGPTKSGLTSMATGSRKRASSWDAGGLSITGDGATVGTGAFDGSMGSTSLAIGCRPDGTQAWFGTISRIAYFPNRLDNSALVAMTA